MTLDLRIRNLRIPYLGAYSAPRYLVLMTLYVSRCLKRKPARNSTETLNNGLLPEAPTKMMESHDSLRQLTVPSGWPSIGMAFNTTLVTVISTIIRT